MAKRAGAHITELNAGHRNGNISYGESREYTHRR
jgi:hypothetical protein